jgi:hypothetical protein
MWVRLLRFLFLFAFYIILVSRVRFQVLMAACMYMKAFCNIATCNLVEVGRRFRGTYCLNLRARTASQHLGVFIALMMEAVLTSETSVYFHEKYVPENCHLYIQHCGNIQLGMRIMFERDRIRNVRSLAHCSWYLRSTDTAIAEAVRVEVNCGKHTSVNHNFSVPVTYNYFLVSQSNWELVVANLSST